jgi:hypothetical protein
MEATQTANKKYDYDDEFYEISLDELVQRVHKYNCKKSGWKYVPLKRGAFGYDNLCMCLGDTFKYLKKHEVNKEKLANRVHKAWIINYVYWRDNSPWLNKEIIYYKPANKLGDARRNKCAELSYDELPDDEKEKDMIIVDFILELLN